MRTTLVLTVLALFLFTHHLNGDPVEVTTPIEHELEDLATDRLQLERDLYSYAPEVTTPIITIGPDNMPYTREDGDGLDTDVTTNPNAKGLSVLTIRDGQWVAYSFESAIESVLVNFDSIGTWSTDAHNDYRIVFDDDGHAYMLAYVWRGSNRYNLLLFSNDMCETWTAHQLPVGRVHPVLEQQDGHNDLSGPPAILTGEYGAPNNLNLILPTKSGSGGSATISIPTPINVATDARWTGHHSGGGNRAVGTAGYVYVSYAQNAAGTPQRVVQINRSTNTVVGSTSVCLDTIVGGDPDVTRPSAGIDDHNQPSITLDSDGYLHLITGAHHAPIYHYRPDSNNEANFTSWDWGTAQNIDDPMGGNAYDHRHTYVALVCDADDTLHVVTRSTDATYTMNLGYLRGTRDGSDWDWEKENLVEPAWSNYFNWHHHLSLDNKGSLWLSYQWFTTWFSADQHDAYEMTFHSDLGSVYGTNGSLSEYRDATPQDPALLVSYNGGDDWFLNGWQLSEAAPFEPYTDWQPWQFPEDSPTLSLRDESGNSHHASRLGYRAFPDEIDPHADSPTIADPRFTGTGLEFDGENDFVEGGDQGVYNETTGFTIFAVVKADPSTLGYIYTEGSSTVQAPFFGLYATSSGKLGVYANDAGNNVLLNVSASTTVFDDNWHTITYVQDAPSSGSANIQIWIDGKRETLTTNTLTTGSLSLDMQTIGAVGHRIGSIISQQNWYEGEVAQLTLYDKPLKKGEIRHLDTWARAKFWHVLEP